MRDKIISYAREKYATDPEYLWLKTPDAFILRNSKNKKWYALVMRVKKSVLISGAEGFTDIINIKCEPLTRECLLAEGKAFPAYHMNKKLWISIILDDNIDFQILCNIIDESYNIVNR
ncbi:MAG: MmcQ/YjbR family DNA-binding protein [Ruminococcus flavefaciens]|nr:MmcQ/YjbR family DNA-binding protein [Ruminococcus flavefaciens]